MYIDEVPNRKSPPAILLRECWREGKRVRKRTLANMTRWPKPVVDAIRKALKGERLASVDDVFAIERSLPHGHVEAVLAMMRRFGLDSLISSRRCRERDLVVAMIAERIVHPCSKLATTRVWHTTTLAQELDVADADENELYDALDWLLARQKRIEKKLAGRHLRDGEQALYDVSSSYYEGRTCVLAVHGFDRDGKKGRPIIVYGVMTDKEGRPIAVDVYPGNTGDPTTVPDQVDKLRCEFGLSRVVLVGDRGMLTQTQIDKLKTHPQLGWISALRSRSIRKLVAAGAIQMSLFDEQNLAEVTSPEFPGERLVVCFNPQLAEERRRKREELLAATEKELDRIVRAVRRRTRTPLGENEIGVRVGKVVNRFKMAKHFELTIADGRLQWARNEETIATEAALDGIYVIRTSEPAERLSAQDAVRSYKSLSEVERAFRTLKGIDLRVRPIHHRTVDHVRAHIFLCLLAYYVEWHMRRALAPLLFHDEQLPDDRKRRDPVAPAQPSPSAKKKKRRRTTDDGLPVHSFETLLEELATRCKNSCRPRTAPDVEAIEVLTDPTPLQSRALELLQSYPVAGNPNRP